MDKKYYDLIEEFDENKLPDVNINEEEINRVKNKVIGVINSLQNENKNIKLDINLEDALKIKEKLGDNADKAIFGVESAGLMRALILKSVREKEGLDKEDIVDELFRNVHAPNWWRGAAVCYKFFLTKDKLIIYSFDSHYKIFSHYKLNIEEIKGAGLVGKAKCHMHEDEQIIILPNTTIYLDPNYGGNKEDLLRFMDSLKKIGVKDINRGGFPWQFFIQKVMWIAIAFVFILLMIMCIKL